MLSVILFCFCICAVPVFLSSVFNKKFEEGLPVSFFGAVMLIYSAGLAANLLAGVYIWAAVSCALYFAALIFILKQKKLREAVKNIFTLPFFIFAFLAVALAVLNVGRLPVGWDEFSHWGSTVKGMLNINDFAANPLSGDDFGSYPPAMSLLQYAIQAFERLFKGEFSEWKLYYVYQLFAFSLLLPFLKEVSKKKALPCFAALFAACVIFAPALMESLYIDSFVGILAAFLFAYIVVADKSLYTCATLSMGLFTLALAKDAGIFFAVTIIFANAAAAYKRLKPLSRRSTVSLLCYSLIPAGSVLLAKISWSLVLSAYNTFLQFKQPISFSYIMDIAANKIISPKNDVLPNYLHKFFIGQHLVFSSLSLTYILGLLLLIFAVIFICRVNKKCNNRYDTLCSVAAVVIFTHILYSASLPFIYIAKFSDIEAPNLASFERYLSIAFSCTLCFTAFCLAALYRKNDSVKKCFYTALVVFAILLPTKAVRGYFTRSTIDDAYNKIRPQYMAVQNFKALCNDKSLKSIGRISFYPDDYECLLTNYYMSPVKLTNITLPQAEAEASQQQYNKQLTELAASFKDKYEYVMVLTIDGFFIEKCGALFENPSEIREFAIYKVNESSGLLRLIA